MDRNNNRCFLDKPRVVEPYNFNYIQTELKKTVLKCHDLFIRLSCV